MRGDFLQASYEEIKNLQKIHSLIREHIPGTSTSSKNFGLDVLCDFTTKRELYLADRKFSIMLDQADFGHIVGEVEILSQDARAAESDIDGFFEKYSWFFQNGKPKGKIAAYLEKYGHGVRVC